MIKHGPVVLCVIGGLPLAFIVVGYVLIPHIMSLPVTSAYEILEGKLGRGNRLLGSAIFLVIRLIWMALVTYLTANKIIVVVMKWSPDVTPWVCAVLGLVTVIYTSMGGLRAVVLTDVIQTFILFGGAVLAIVMISLRMGGVDAWWPTEWVATWDHQPLFSLDPHVRASVVGTILMIFIYWTCTAGSDQMAIQRHLATRDAAAARRAFLITMAANALVFILLGLLGLALLGFFQAGFLGSGGLDVRTHADELFPRFIVSHLPMGVSGLIVSGLLAAAMSSLSSGVNSAGSVLVVDFAPLVSRRTYSEEEKARLAKATAFATGLVVVLLSMVIGKVPGNLFEVTQKTVNLFTTPLFGLFFMAMFVPFATPFGAAFGTLYGAVAAILVGFWDLITGQPPVSFTWIMPVSLAVNIVAGCLLSLLPTRGQPAIRLLLWSVVPVAALFLFVAAIVL
jgi:SSS family solute:Na+ symporter